MNASDSGCLFDTADNLQIKYDRFAVHQNDISWLQIVMTEVGQDE